MKDLDLSVDDEKMVNNLQIIKEAIESLEAQMTSVETQLADHEARISALEAP